MCGCCACTHVWAALPCLVWRTEEGATFPVLGDTVGCETPCGIKLGVQSVLLTTEAPKPSPKDHIGNILVKEGHEAKLQILCGHSLT